MNYLENLFSNLRDLTRYAPGADGVSSLQDMEAAARSAHRRVCSIITQPVYEAIVADSQQSDLMEPLRAAMANLTLCVQLSFDVINRRKNNVDVYKYELEGMKRSYMENYYNAMDALVEGIDGSSEEADDATEKAVAEAWKESRYRQLIGSCQVKTASDFDAVYNIDGSSLFFFRTLPIQKEIIDTRLGVYFDKIAAPVPDASPSGYSRVAAMLRLALCKKVVATALRRFDILECPATIRNLFDDSKVSGQRKDERDSAFRLADMLDSEADALISDIDMLLTADNATDISSWSGYNQPDDVIVMMP